VDGLGGSIAESGSGVGDSIAEPAYSGVGDSIPGAPGRAAPASMPAAMEQPPTVDAPDDAAVPPPSEAPPVGYPPLEVAPTAAPAFEAAEAAPAEEEPRRDTAPNWMLAFVCAWAGGFALYQAWDSLRRGDLTQALRTYAVGGYTSLGLGLVLCTIEALLWNRFRRHEAARVVLLLLPLVLILAGVWLLFMFKDPDPSRSKI
jgi:hypothetical protein